jgi:hypothetical protein
MTQISCSLVLVRRLDDLDHLDLYRPRVKSPQKHVGEQEGAIRRCLQPALGIGFNV